MILETFNLKYAIHGREILKGINFKIPTNGISVILGGNGTGKSTLLSLLAGLTQPTEGKIMFQGASLPGPDQKLIPGHSKIALVRQDMKLTPFASVKENLEHIIRNLEENEQTEILERLSKLLGIQDLMKKTLKFLSGGEQQRVSIAAALASSPDLLLMDEPFSQTDLQLKHQLKQYLRSISEQINVSILFVTHDPQEALALADHIFILNEGRIIEEGNNQALYHRPECIKTAKLTGYCNWLPAEFKHLSKNAHLVQNQLLLRPEKIKLFLTPDKEVIPAYVEKVEFAGLYSLVIVSLNDIQLIALNTHSSQIRPGQQVYIRF